MIIVNYHQISVRGGRSPYDMSQDLFRDQIDTLIDLGFSFVTLDDIVDSPAEEQPRQCAITFDDGRLGAYEPGSGILKERGIKATHFICPDWLEKKPASPAERYSDFMTWEQLAELARQGHLVGSHGKSHVRLLEVDARSADCEISESKTMIEQKLGISCDHFASPWGEVDRSLMSLVRTHGYSTLSTTVVGPNKISYEPYRLRRIDSSAYRSRRDFETAVVGLVEAHARLDVALLEVRGAREKSAVQIESLGAFDHVHCLSEQAHDFSLRLGLRCSRAEAQLEGGTPTREMLGEMARDRTITITPVTLRDPGWTSLLSFLPGTSRTR